ncbi:hypothetical protein OJ253_738 [Cryptosporidium canis]|uniref:Uncharacterized protein n=1 Tax=Cryptosporidium canis TaxID=195482 RepID=A0A9D5HYL6_9CRYT|nr:hypothetical protein OJ253_738 [Cryptosporidium canis]
MQLRILENPMKMSQGGNCEGQRKHQEECEGGGNDLNTPLGGAAADVQDRRHDNTVAQKGVCRKREHLEC